MKKLNNFYFLIYLIPISIAINYYLSINDKNISKSDFFDYLYKRSYFPIKNNPYAATDRLEIHPTNYFSLPKKSSQKLKINNEVFSLNLLGHRYNPYAPKSNKNKNCILFLGSSAGFGVGASSNYETIPAILNNKLGNEYFVYNLAVPSWNSRQELISLINIISKKELSPCKTVQSISFTATTDITSIRNNKRSTFFNDKDSLIELTGASEHFATLEKNIISGRKSKTDLKYNLQMVFKQVNEKLFGAIIEKVNSFKKNNVKKSRKKNINKKTEFLIANQINNFIYNHKIINNLMLDMSGKHLVVLQPNLNNHTSDESIWSLANIKLTKQLREEKCLNVLDLRFKFIDIEPKYNVEGNMKPLSLKDAIIQNKSNEVNLYDHYFYDNSHLTDKGSNNIAEVLFTSFKNNSKINCLNKENSN